jgi:sporulation protein YlmC with PRC-barrel domain
MLRHLSNLERYAVAATDGDVGRVADFLLDDLQWTIRYLVVDTGGFLHGREVLISPIAFRDVDWTERRFRVALTVDKVKQSPDVDTDKPVSRQHESALSRYYHHLAYWGYAGLWGTGGYPGSLAVSGWTDGAEEAPEQTAGDVHLRSTKEVRGYRVDGSDGEIGHVSDFIVDDETWTVRYLVLDTSNWWVGKKILVASDWIGDVSWLDRSVQVALSREVVQQSPEWDELTPINSDYQARLCAHYKRPAYSAVGSPPEQTLLSRR